MEKTKSRTVKEPEVELITAYGATAYHYGDERVGSESWGPFLDEKRAKRYLASARRSLTRRHKYESGHIWEKDFVKVGGKFYEINGKIMEIVKPSELEAKSNEVVALKIGNTKVVKIFVNPTEVRGKKN